MKKLSILSVFALSLLLLVSSFAIAAEKDITFVSPASNAVLEDEVSYNVNIEYPAENVDAYEVNLYTIDDEFIVGSSGSFENSLQGTFTVEQDGDYYLEALFLLDDGSLMEETVFFSVNFSVVNDLKILGYANPTPFTNSLINSNNINAAKIVAVTNKDTDSFNVYIYNDSDTWSEDFAPERKTDFSLYNFWLTSGDGVFSFMAEANVFIINAKSVERTITIKATVPELMENYSASFPSSINEDASFSVDLTDVMIIDSFMSTEWNLRVDAIDGLNYDQLGPVTVNDANAGNISISGNIAEPGFYNLTLVLSDSYGNSKSYELGNMTVNDVEVLTEVSSSGRRGGGGSSNNEETQSSGLVRVWNLERVDGQDQEEDEGNTVSVDTDEQNGALSFITGAVTGAFSTPPRAILTFIILVVIIYAIVKIRGYMVADAEKEKPKKNGKKAKKEKVEEAQTE